MSMPKSVQSPASRETICARTVIALSPSWVPAGYSAGRLDMGRDYKQACCPVNRKTCGDEIRGLGDASVMDAKSRLKSWEDSFAEFLVGAATWTVSGGMLGALGIWIWQGYQWLRFGTAHPISVAEALAWFDVGLPSRTA